MNFLCLCEGPYHQATLTEDLLPVEVLGRILPARAGRQLAVGGAFAWPVRPLAAFVPLPLPNQSLQYNMHASLRACSSALVSMCCYVG